MNIFNQAPEFIELDNRKNRTQNAVTPESTHTRLEVSWPEWLIKDGTVLDLGSCLGAAGHWALTYGATHYTGVEIQQTYADGSVTALSKYWPADRFTIVTQSLEDFLDNAIANNIQYDHVLASGVLYAFLNFMSVLEKITKVARKSVVIDTLWIPKEPNNNNGIIVIKPKVHINYANGDQAFAGWSSIVNMRGLDIIMQNNYFFRTEDRLVPRLIEGITDVYSDTIVDTHGIKRFAAKYIVRYFRQGTKTLSLQDHIKTADKESLVPFQTAFPVVKDGTDVSWKFDSSVADRFQQEALQHIPDYKRVIDMCIDVANNSIRPELKATAPIIDFGSALGFTVDAFINNGFANTYGLDNSPDMVAKSLHPERIILGDKLPNQMYSMIMINWTLHFIIDKFSYLQDFYNKLSPGGTLIISDKTTQTIATKELYYQFKLDNGVDPEYIKEKEKALIRIMNSMPVDWYVDHLRKAGFPRIEIINARYGFVTFMCKKL
jgi:hypothetical protein